MRDIVDFPRGPWSAYNNFTWASYLCNWWVYCNFDEYDSQYFILFPEWKIRFRWFANGEKDKTPVKKSNSSSYMQQTFLQLRFSQRIFECAPDIMQRILLRMRKFDYTRSACNSIRCIVPNFVIIFYLALNIPFIFYFRVKFFFYILLYAHIFKNNLLYCTVRL